MLLTKEVESSSKGVFKTISSILKNDGVLVHETGSLIRARTGSPIGSEDDITVCVSYRNPEDGAEHLVHVRAGIPVVDRRRDINAAPLSSWVHAHSITIHRDGSFQAADGERFHAIDWPPGSTPFDLIAIQNWVVAVEEQRPYTPPWIAELPQDDKQASLKATG